MTWKIFTTGALIASVIVGLFIYFSPPESDPPWWETFLSY